MPSGARAAASVADRAGTFQQPRPSLLLLTLAVLFGFGVGLSQDRARGADLTSSLAALTNLPALVNRIPVGLNPESGQGPKGIEAADFNGDLRIDLAVSNTDGSVTVLFGLGNGRFERPIHLRIPTSSQSLRGIAVADFNRDGSPDIAVASPSDGKVQIFYYNAILPLRFTAPQALETWRGARNLEAADFDGDGWMDLAVAGPNLGLRQYRGLPGGTFVVVTNHPDLNFTFEEQEKFPKPLYSLARFRVGNDPREALVAGHAEGTNLWIFRPGAEGQLEIAARLGGRANVHGIAVGPLRQPIGSPTNDLITVFRDTGVLDLRFATNQSLAFGGDRSSIYVPGGPRAVSLVDLNADGWNDLVVVVRNLDVVVTYLNDRRGNFALSSTRPVGSSPRELVTADLNGDARPDVAVMNRDSSDLAILLASDQAPGYRAVDGLYLVDGQVAGLAAVDFNQDGFDDIIQLHRASGDFSVRLARPDGSGRLEDPVFYTVGNVPAAQVIQDLNGDGLLDVATANLGNRPTGGGTLERSSVSIRLGQAGAPGTLGPEIRIELPPDVEGRLFALQPGDFDRDGPLDLVVGTLDGKLAFFKGAGDGTFTHVRTRRIQLSDQSVSQPRSLTTGDFDADGDLDLAGLDANGEMWVMENPWQPGAPSQHLFNAPTVAVRRFPPPTDGFGGRKIVATRHDGDTILDLVIGTGRGAWLYTGLGGPGATNFAAVPTRLAGISNLVSDFVLRDLDNDGNEDVVLSCRDRDCLAVFASRNALASGLPYDAPSSRFLAVGDLDGDSRPDFIGSGRVLWTSLSSRPPSTAPPLIPSGERIRLNGVVINEILASNSDLPLDADGGRNSDWVEIHNGGQLSQTLAGWTLSLEELDVTGRPTVSTATLPPTAFIAPGASLVLVCSEIKRTFYHTGYRLPASGGTILLRDASGVLRDRVTYPPQRANISYARYRDALRSFVYNPFPSPGRSNPVNGTAEPTLKFAGVDPDSFRPGNPIRFQVEVSEDLGAVSSLLLHYQTLAIGANSPPGQLQLFDDGLHGDGEASDGLFAGELPFTVSSPTELQFFFELTDLGDNIFYAPEDPEFGVPGAVGNAYQLGFAQPRSPLEISEIVAWNTDGLVDGTNGHPDWIEIRNPSPGVIPLTGVAVSQQVGDNPRYRFLNGRVLGPGGASIVLCDNKQELGAGHAPIGLKRDGDTVMLTGVTTNGSRTLIDIVKFGPQEPNVAWARLGPGGPFRPTTPTPTNGNIAPVIVDGVNSAWEFIPATNGLTSALMGIPTQPGVPGTVEYCPDLSVGTWLPLDQFIGTGIERTYSLPGTNAVFLRWR